MKTGFLLRTISASKKVAELAFTIYKRKCRSIAHTPSTAATEPWKSIFEQAQPAQDAGVPDTFCQATLTADGRLNLHNKLSDEMRQDII